MELEKQLLLCANSVRQAMVAKYGSNLCGKCIETSDRIIALLSEIGIKAAAVEGWCVYEDDSSCTDRCYDEHTWVDCHGYYVDVTADQFNSCMFTDLASVIVSPQKPDCMVLEEPEYKWLEDRECKEKLFK